MGSKNKLSEEKKLEIYEALLTGKYQTLQPTKLAKILGVASGTISNYRDRLGIKWKRSRYFEIFDTLGDAQLGYLCGLVASDGSISRALDQIKLVLQEDDKATVEYFAQALTIPPSVISYTNAKGPEEFKGRRPQYYTGPMAPKFIQYCLAMGITPNKSLTLDVKLDDKSDEFRRYFLRGVIDGDGNISLNPKTENTSGCYIGITSASVKFLETLKRHYGGTLQLYDYPVCSVLRIQGMAGKDLALWLPTDDFTMKRKTEKIVEYQNRKDAKFRRNEPVRKKRNKKDSTV